MGKKLAFFQITSLSTFLIVEFFVTKSNLLKDSDHSVVRILKFLLYDSDRFIQDGVKIY
jgi:hypothetical protein